MPENGLLQEEIGIVVGPYPVTIQIHECDKINGDAVGWLQKRARPGMTLLAHADDGIIWGKGDEGEILFAPDALFDSNFERVQFSNQTLQMARLFNETEETFFWRVDEGQWRARTIIDGEAHGMGEKLCRMDRCQVLWGTRIEVGINGFCRVADGQEGLRHTPPLYLEKTNWVSDDTDGNNRGLRLLVRQYIQEDEITGQLQMDISRLVKLYAEENPA
ncbi:MAG: TIGR03984 family CRISPR-associated protein [Caldilineaceae bacterium]|nr:TIGR03984 family CRISPR-associated protein [Caldilineaceae bacterium]